MVGDATVKGSETGSSFRQALYAMECGFRLHDTMIWNKGGFSAVGALVSRYAPVFEYIFIWSKGEPKTFNPIKDRPNKHAGQKNHGTVRRPDGSTVPKTNDRVMADFGQRFNIWEISPQRQRGAEAHPAPFPEVLAADLIRTWTDKGALVLDPFLGSGTTGAAAVPLERHFVGFEREPEYFEMARSRICGGRPVRLDPFLLWLLAA